MALAPTSRLHWAGTYDQALDYAAGTVVLQGGALYRARVLRPHGAAAPADDADSWDTLASAPAGVPVLYGPYVVDYNMPANGGGTFDHDAAKVDLWVPAIGDVLLRLFPDSETCTQWDHGDLWIGQNLDEATPANRICEATAGNIAGWNTNVATLDNITDAIAGTSADSLNNNVESTGRVFHSSDPVQIMLATSGGTEPGRGHVEIYALVARAVAP